MHKLVLVTDTTQRLAQDVLDVVHCNRDPHYTVRRIRELAEAAQKAEADGLPAVASTAPSAEAASEFNRITEAAASAELAQTDVAQSKVVHEARHGVAPAPRKGKSKGKADN